MITRGAATIAITTLIAALCINAVSADNNPNGKVVDGKSTTYSWSVH